MVSSNSVSLVVLFMFFINCAFANICDFCDCQPSRHEVFSITCGCEQTKNLYFSSNQMKGAETAAMIIVKNCQMVNVQQNSFSQLEKLDTLAIQNSLFVSISAGAFTSLNSLLINNVQDISFREMALMGARGIKNIIINSSNITQLPKYALYDLKGLERLTLGNVSIGQINREAINVSAKNIVLQNIQVNHIEANGLSLQAEKVLIKNSNFANPSVDSINIRTVYQTRILNNHFGGTFQANVTSPFAEYSGNHFENLQVGGFANTQMSRVMNNTIQHMESYKSFKNFDFKDFYDNYFQCNCGMNLLDQRQRYDSYDIFKKNFCIANCSLSLFEFEVESMARCTRDHQVDVNGFCTYERTNIYNNRRFKKLDNDRENAAKNFSVNEIEPRFLVHGNEDVNSTSAAFSMKMCSSLFGFALMTFLFVQY